MRNAALVFVDVAPLFGVAVPCWPVIDAEEASNKTTKLLRCSRQDRDNDDDEQQCLVEVEVDVDGEDSEQPSTSGMQLLGGDETNMQVASNLLASSSHCHHQVDDHHRTLQQHGWIIVACNALVGSFLLGLVLYILLTGDDVDLPANNIISGNETSDNDGLSLS